MEILLDTHILLWALTNNPKLPRKALDLIQNKDNDIYYSVASIWEATIKYAIRPDNMPISGKALSEYCRKATGCWQLGKNMCICWNHCIGSKKLQGTMIRLTVL